MLVTGLVLLRPGQVAIRVEVKGQRNENSTINQCHQLLPRTLKIANTAAVINLRRPQPRALWRPSRGAPSRGASSHQLQQPPLAISVPAPRFEVTSGFLSPRVPVLVILPVAGHLPFPTSF
ncbi:unnamed protein product [Lampetra fluviatilis]